MAASNQSPPQASNIFELTSKSPDETRRFGESLGARLQPGDVLALIGELGSGKTTFIQGVAKGLGVDPALVKSPTFVLMREYPGRIGLTHVDGYRIEGDPSLIWLDLEAIFSPRRVTVIEWADRCAGCLPDDHLELHFAHTSSNQRAVSLRAHGARSTEIVQRLS